MRREDFRRKFGRAGSARGRRGRVPSGNTSSKPGSTTSPTTTAGWKRSKPARKWACCTRTATSWSVEASNNYEYLSEPFEIASGLWLPVGSYRFNEVEARYQLGPQRKANGNLWVGGGQFYDGTRTQVGYRGRIELTRGSASSPA